MASALLGTCAQQAKEDPAVTSMRAAVDSQSQMLAAVNTWVAAWDSGNTDGLDAITAARFSRKAPDKNADSLNEFTTLIADVQRCRGRPARLAKRLPRLRQRDRLTNRVLLSRVAVGRSASSRAWMRRTSLSRGTSTGRTAWRARPRAVSFSV